MDDATHKQWWPLHLRAALGETLSAEEQTLYEAGSRQLDAEEERTLQGSTANLLRARQKNAEMKAEYNRLHSQIEDMERQIILAEERLAVPAKQLLGVGK